MSTPSYKTLLENKRAFITEITNRLNLKEEYKGKKLWNQTLCYPFYIELDNAKIGCIGFNTNTHNPVNLVEILHLEIKRELRGQGFGRKVMRIICELADKHSIILDVMPEPLDKSSKHTRDQLRAWYADFSFVLCNPRGFTMERHPKKEHK